MLFYTTLVEEKTLNFIQADTYSKKRLALQQRKIFYEMNICIVI